MLDLLVIATTGYCQTACSFVGLLSQLNGNVTFFFLRVIYPFEGSYYKYMSVPT